MKSNIVIDTSTLFPYEAKLCFSNHRSKCGWTIKLQVSLKCNISRKKKVMEVIFGMQINIKVFYKLVLSFYVCVVRHAKITQTKKFAYLCSKIRRQWSWFFFLQKATKVLYKMIVSLLGVPSLTFSKYSEKPVYNIFATSKGKRQGFFACW